MKPSKNQAQQLATPPALDDMLFHAEVLADARRDLGEMVSALNQGIESLKADAMPQIRAAIELAGAAWSRLEVAISDHPELFMKPRSIEAHGIKFGYAKGKGGFEIADPVATVALIHKHLPEVADVLIQTVEKPVKAAMSNLSASDLKRIAVNVNATGDVVFIKPAEGTVDKLVKALVAAAVEVEVE